MKKSILSIAIIFISLSVYSQSDKKQRVTTNALINQSYAFNFFTGPDAKQLTTTPKAFGSGLYDLSMVIPATFWIYNPKNRNIGLFSGAGLDITKYRFQQPYIFDLTNNNILVDTNSLHIYRNNFFTRDGSKLVLGKLIVPISVYFPISKWFGKEDLNFGISLTAFYKRYLFAYLKDFYIENGALTKDKYSNTSISKYFTHDDIGGRVAVKIFSFYVWGQYTYTNLFTNLIQYEIHETKIGITFDFNFNKKSNSLKNEEEGTETEL